MSTVPPTPSNLHPTPIDGSVSVAGEPADALTCRFVTFGCKINQYDTQAIRESVLELGYREAQKDESPSLVVVNSCTVTDSAGRKGVTAVRKLTERHPGARVLVTGCLSPEDRAACEAIAGVAVVIGNEEKDQIPALVQGAAPVSVGPRVSDRRRSKAIFDLSASRFDGRTRAFLKVHDGCDDFCSYCIIPMVRGKSKSRPIDDVLEEARRFADHGFREVVVTGIHLRRYGSDLGLEGGVQALMAALREVPGIERIRLSSIGEKTFTPEFLDFIASDEAYCPFFHIPLQSGSDSVLERMRREYSVAEYLETVDHIRERLPRAVITTDLMIGFPGETEREFEESLDTCRAARFAFLHVFPYSVRTGTKAANLPDRVPGAVRKERVERARELDRSLRAEEARGWIGRDARVLVESTGSRSRVAGLTREGHRCFIETDRAFEKGSEIDVRIVAPAAPPRWRDTGPVCLDGSVVGSDTAAEGGVVAEREGTR